MNSCTTSTDTLGEAVLAVTMLIPTAEITHHDRGHVHEEKMMHPPILTSPDKNDVAPPQITVDEEYIPSYLLMPMQRWW